jgi:hypothetical protein
MMDYEDSDASFGNDAISQNQALINFIGEKPDPFNPNSDIITEGPFNYAQFLNSGSQPPLEKLVQDVTEATPLAPALAPAITTAPKTPAAPAKVDYTSALAKQILGQGITDKWSGEGFGSADANAADMAKILAGIGITDISQFGKITVPVEVYMGTESEGGPPIYETQMQETYGNKLTGQAVPNTYSERQTGNFFGGTFSGKGNTGYGVQFDSQGNPIFYTQGASSSDIGKIAPLLTMASFIPGVAPFAQGLNALIAAKQGNVLGAALSAFGAAGAAGIAGPQADLNSPLAAQCGGGDAGCAAGHGKHHASDGPRLLCQRRHGHQTFRRRDGRTIRYAGRQPVYPVPAYDAR